MINIELSNYEAEQFRLYQKYHDVFEQLDKNKVFGMEFGKVIISIAFSEIQNVVKEEMVFRRVGK